MTAVYAYHPDGLRLLKRVNGVMHTHVWCGMHIVLELNANRQVMNRFIRGLTLLSSYFHGWYVHNARGDVVQLIGNEGGAVLRTYRYTAFGVEINASVGDTNPFRFAAEYYDRETGRIYLRARFFDPRIGRFTQPDPHWNVGNMQRCSWSVIQSGNLFVFGINNPVRFIDPLGLYIIVAANSSNANAILSSLQSMTQDDLRWASSRCRTYWRLTITQSSSSTASAGTEMLREMNTSGTRFNLTNSLTDLDVSVGVSLVIAHGNFHRNVTVPVNAALRATIREGTAVAAGVNIPFIGAAQGAVARWPWFLSQVNHGAPWDIKRPGPWRDTIGSTYPGFGVHVYFRGYLMTVEALGN